MPLPAARKLFAGLAALSLLAAPAAGGTVRAGELVLELSEARALALKALKGGQPELALALARALAEQDPADYEARLIIAAAETRLGNGEAGTAAARAALTLAESRGEKLFAAREIASGLAEQGRWAASQFWLRRAAGWVDAQDQMQLLARDYGYVRARNPWRGQISLSVGPNPNITNAASADVIWIYTPFGALPMVPTVYSGMTAETSAALSYRFSHDGGAASYLGLSGYARVNHLDAESTALLGSGDSERDFDFAQAALTLRHVRPFGEGAFVDVTASLGRSWYGWAPYADFATAGAALRGFKAGALDVTVFANARAQDFASGAAPVVSGEIGARFGHAFAGGDKIGLTLAAERSASSDAASEYRGARAELSYDLGQPVLGAELSFEAAAALRDYAYSPWSSTGRRDVTVSAGIEAAFPAVSAMGFVPVISAGVERHFSDIVIYDSQSYRLGFGLRSQF